MSLRFALPLLWACVASSFRSSYPYVSAPAARILSYANEEHNVTDHNMTAHQSSLTQAVAADANVEHAVFDQNVLPNQTVVLGKIVAAPAASNLSFRQIQHAMLDLSSDPMEASVYVNDQNMLPNPTVVLTENVAAESISIQRSWRGRYRDNFWRNIFIDIFVLIPCGAVGAPLFWNWYYLKPVGKVDEIFTATCADLREVEISRVGASGVALLRRQEDRHTGIMFAFTGIMLQTIFIYFIAVACVLRLSDHIARDESSMTPVPLLFCSLFCNTMVCSSSIILGMKCRETDPPAGYQKLHETLVLLDSFVIPGICAVVGALYLCTSTGISSLVFDATAMAFIISINTQIAGLMSWSLSGHGGRAFQPANVSIKDSENSTQLANYTLLASVIVATVTLPLGLLIRMI